MFGLGFVEAYGFGVFHHAFQAQVQHGLRGVGRGEEFGGGFVHAFVGGLRGKQDGNQEFGRVWCSSVRFSGAGFRRASVRTFLGGFVCSLRLCGVLLFAEQPGREGFALRPKAGAFGPGVGFGGGVGGEIGFGLLFFWRWRYSAKPRRFRFDSG